MTFGGNQKTSEPRVLRAGVVTSLAAKGAQGDRVAVYVDGKHAFDLNALLAAESGLRKDDYLSEERQAELVHADEPHLARDVALSALARKERCEREISAVLVRKGISMDIAEQTIAWLRERGYVDDRRFAAAYAKDRQKAGWGRQRIVSELLRRGIARDIVAGDAWHELSNDLGTDGERQQLEQLVRRRFSNQLRDDPEVARRRIIGFLTRRGHDWDSIASVLRSVINESTLSDGVS